MEIALYISLALNFFVMLGVVFYMAKTTWHAQNKQSDMEKLLTTHTLASNPMTQPMAGIVDRVFAPQAPQVPMADTMVGRDVQGRPVRVPLSSLSSGSLPNLFDEDSDLDGN